MEFISPGQGGRGRRLGCTRRNIVTVILELCSGWNRQLAGELEVQEGKGGEGGSGPETREHGRCTTSGKTADGKAGGNLGFAEEEGEDQGGEWEGNEREDLVLGRDGGIGINMGLRPRDTGTSRVTVRHSYRTVQYFYRYPHAYCIVAVLKR